MSGADDPRARLAAAMGVAPGWRDIGGRDHETGIDTQIALLAAMGLDAATPERASALLAAREAAAARRRMPPEMVVETGRAAHFHVTGPWLMELEDGGVREGVAEAHLRLEPPEGAHLLRAGGETCLLIVAPPRAPSVADLAGASRIWGAMAPLWGLASRRSLGVGDYVDLAATAETLGELGAAFVGINPVHALGAAHEGISPYAPTSRIAYAEAHIAPDAAPGFAECEAARALSAEAAEGVALARSGPLAQWRARDAAAAPALRALFEAGGRDDPDFTAWLAGRGAALEGFALCEALSLRFGEDWRAWPVGHEGPEAPAARAFARACPDEPRFRLWLQWLADAQLAAAQAAARGAGMAIGLYLDLAVGVRPDGADVWANREAFAQGVSLGAPPDRLSPKGQVWSLAPFAPEGLRACGYAPFRAALRAAMRHAGMIRIDHVLGFARAYWAPDGGEPGGYVAYPFDALMALTRLEAKRARCLVIGEDLGTVPEGFRDRLGASGLYGCAVMQFEREHGVFTPPRLWRDGVSASFGTHDTPTLRGWLRGREIDWREKVGDYDETQANEARDARAHEIAAFDRMLRAEGFAPDDEASTAASAHAALAASPAPIAALSLDDALGAVEQQNLPGTVHAHPNWRRRLPCAVEALADNVALRELAGLFGAARPGRSRAAPQTRPDSTEETPE